MTDYRLIKIAKQYAISSGALKEVQKLLELAEKTYDTPPVKPQVKKAGK